MSHLSLHWFQGEVCGHRLLSLVHVEQHTNHKFEAILTLDRHLLLKHL
jgi:hypothetical protein